MDLIITWVMFSGLAAVLAYSSWKERSARAAAAHRGRKPLPHHRAAMVFGTFNVMSWGLFLGAVCFPISAIAGTADALF